MHKSATQKVEILLLKKLGEHMSGRRNSNLKNFLAGFCLFITCFLSVFFVERAFADTKSGSNSSNYTIPVVPDPWYEAYSGITISGAPSNAVIEKIVVSWNIDHNWVSDVDVRFASDTWYGSWFTLSKTGNDTEILPPYYSETSSGTKTYYPPSTVSVNQTWYLVAKDTYYDGNEYDDGRIDSWDITVYYTVPDTTPPTPSTMSFSTSPYAASTTSVSMTATAASDPSGVEYYFDAVYGSPGRTDSGWQSSRSYTDTGLAANTRYGYTIQARDTSPNYNLNISSGTSYCYTLQETPAVIITSTGSTSISVEANNISNVSSGSSAVQWDADYGYGSGDRSWEQSTAYTDSGLEPGREYRWRAQARNGDGITTSWGEFAYACTTANTPAAPTVTSQGTSSVSVNVNPNANSSVVQYAIYCNTTNQYVTSSGGLSSTVAWQTDSVWGSTVITGLNSNTSYSFKVKAKNEWGIETSWSSNGTATTDPPPTHTVTGQVKSRRWPYNGIPGVTVQSETGQSTITDQLGNYTLPNVPQGNRTITASRSDYWATGTSDSEGKPANVTSNTTVNFSQFACKGTALATVDVDKSTVLPGETVNVTVTLKNTNYALSNVASFLDLSFDDSRVTVGSPSGSGWTNITPFPVGSSIYPAVGASSITSTEYLISAEHIGSFANNGTYSFTVPLTVKSSATPGTITLKYRGTIGDETDPDSTGSGTLDQQGWNVKTQNVSVVSTHTVTGQVKSRRWPYNGIPGVTVQSDTGQSTTTDQLGNYTFSNIPQGNRTITASRSDYWATGTSDSESKPVSVTNNTTVSFSQFACKGTALATIDVDKSTVLPGETVNVTVTLKNTNYALSNVASFLDLSFDDSRVTVGSPSGSGWTTIAPFPVGSSIYPAVGSSSITSTEYLISAEHTGSFANNGTYSFTVPLTVKESATPGAITLKYRGTIGDETDPDSTGSGTLDQQGWNVKELDLLVSAIPGALFDQVWQTVNWDTESYDIHIATSDAITILNRSLDEVIDGGNLRYIFIKNGSSVVSQPPIAHELLIGAQSAKKFQELDLNSIIFSNSIHATDIERIDRTPGFDYSYTVYPPFATSDWWREMFIFGIDNSAYRTDRYKEVLLDVILQPDVSDEILDDSKAILFLENFMQGVEYYGYANDVHTVLTTTSNFYLNKNHLVDFIQQSLAGTLPKGHIVSYFEKLNTVLEPLSLGIDIGSDVVRYIFIKAAADTLAENRLDAIRDFVETNSSNLDQSIVNGFYQAEVEFRALQDDWYSANGIKGVLEAAVISNIVDIANFGVQIASHYGSHALAKVVLPYYLSYKVYMGIREQSHNAQYATLSATLYEELSSSGFFQQLQSALQGSNNNKVDINTALNLTQIHFYLSWYFYDRCLYIFNNGLTSIWGSIYDYLNVADYSGFIDSLNVSLSNNMEKLLVTSPSLYLTRHNDPLNYSATDNEYAYLASKLSFVMPDLTGDSSLQALINIEEGQVVGGAPLSIDFTSNSIGTPSEFIWDFGNGQISTIENPSSVIYNTPGTYYIYLTVRDGENESVSQPVIVTVIDEVVVAQFTGDRTSGTAPLVVNFVNNTIPIVSGYLWSFGDGNYSNDVNPTHTYQNPGVFSVSLRAYGKTWQDDEVKFGYINVDGVTGTIEFVSNINAPFFITGPQTYNGYGTSKTFTNVPVGAYTITYGMVEGYLTPQAETYLLENNSTITFSAVYEPTSCELFFTSGPFGNPNPVSSNGNVGVSVTATDTNGHNLNYFWSSNCPNLTLNGSFDNAYLQNPIWTAPLNTTGLQQDCTIQVVVDDGQGLIKSASYTQQVTPFVIPDLDGDGFGDINAGGTDCNDNDVYIYPGAPEICDGKANNCNNLLATDGSGESWYGNQTSCGQGLCATTGQYDCVAGAQTDNCQPLSPPEVSEVTCSDGQDNDCDGQIDQLDGDCSTTTGIIIDGDPSDWSGITPYKVDAQGDSICGADADIKHVSVSMDEQNAYFMVEMWDAPVSPNAVLEINFDYKLGQHHTHTETDDIHMNVSAIGLSAWNDNDLDGNNEVYPISGYVVSWGNVIEVQIPLSELENAAYFKPTFVNIWDYDYSPMDQGCDATFIYDPQTIGSISGTVTNDNGDPVFDAFVSSYDIANDNWIGWAKTLADGSYLMDGIPAGDYLVKVDATGDGYVREYFLDADGKDSAQAVTVTAGQDTPGIDFSISPGATLTGVITTDGSPASHGWIDIYSVDQGQWLMNTVHEGYTINETTGEWRAALPAGTYKLWAGAEPDETYPSKYYGDTYLFDDATEVTVSVGDVVSGLDIDLSSAKATISGSNSYAGPETGLMITWISPNAGNDFPNMTSGSCCDNGPYSIPAPAGDWYVKAFVDVNENLSYDTGEPFGEYTGGPVTVAAGDSLTDIDIIWSGCSDNYYADADGDGYGDANSSVQGCSPPAGYVLDNSDCDDNDISINPEADEICDLADNDCDGQTDEGCQTIQANIVYSSTVSGNYDIWLMDSNGQNQVQLTTDPADETSPKWSPDGSKIAYRKNGELWLMGADGFDQRRISTSEALSLEFTWHPSGQQIYFLTRNSIYSINIDGTEETLILTKPSSQFSNPYSIDISQDGKTLVYCYQYTNWTPYMQIFAYDLVAGTETIVLDNDGIRDFWARISPDDNFIVWSKDTDADPYNAGMDIWRMGIDGSAPANLTASYDTEFSKPTYSFDGGRIYMQGKEGNQWNIYVMNGDGTGLQQVTTDSSANEIDVDVLWVEPATPPIFEEDWESGIIDSGKWISFGSPLPKIAAGVGNPGYAFDNNGDPNYNSGALSVQKFDYSQGLIIESDIYVTSNPAGCWIGSSIAIASSATNYGSTAWPGSVINMSYDYSGSLCWGDPDPKDQGALSMGILLANGSTESQRLPFYNDYLDGWHRVKIIIHPDRTASFYIDSLLIYTTVGQLTLDYNNMPLLLGMRSSSYGKAYHDNIVVRSYGGTCKEIIYYADADGDGYGDANSSVQGCVPSAGYVLNATDCDDNESTVYPTAPELCDGILNDCNGTLPATEIDNDGDGYVECTIDAGGWDGDPGVVGGDDADPFNPLVGTYLGSESSLMNVYHFSGLGHDLSKEKSAIRSLSFDGAGFFAMTGVENDSTIGSNISVSGSGAYVLGIDGMGLLSVPGPNTMDMSLKNTKDVLVYADVMDAGWQEAGIGVQAGISGFNNASLNDKYYFTDLYRGDGWTACEIGSITFDGAGSFDASVLFSETGVGASLVDVYSGIYSVNDDSTFTLQTPEPSIISGGIKDDGSIFIGADVGDMNEQGFWFGVKAGSSGYTNESLKGIYYMTDYTVNPGGVYSSMNKLVFDGSGNFSMEQTYNHDATGANQSQIASGTYSVNDDGTFFINAGGEITNAALSADGQSFITARIDDATVQGISFGIKLSSFEADIDRDEDVDGSDLAFFAQQLSAGTNAMNIEAFAAGFGR